MGVYIPGIKMPKDEPGAFKVIVMYVGADGKLRAECEGTHEVIPVPPHGRLGDLEELMLQIQDYIEEYGETDEHGWHNEKWCAMKEAQMAIESAPTIIPAEECEI